MKVHITGGFTHTVAHPNWLDEIKSSVKCHMRMINEALHEIRPDLDNFCQIQHANVFITSDREATVFLFACEDPEEIHLTDSDAICVCTARRLITPKNEYDTWYVDDEDFDSDVDFHEQDIRWVRKHILPKALADRQFEQHKTEGSFREQMFGWRAHFSYNIGKHMPHAERLMKTVQQYFNENP